MLLLMAEILHFLFEMYKTPVNTGRFSPSTGYCSPISEASTWTPDFLNLDPLGLTSNQFPVERLRFQRRSTLW